MKGNLAPNGKRIVAGRLFFGGHPVPHLRPPEGGTRDRGDRRGPIGFPGRRRTEGRRMGQVVWTEPAQDDVTSTVADLCFARSTLRRFHVGFDRLPPRRGLPPSSAD